MVKVATVIIVSVIVAIVFAALGIVIGGIIKDKKAENDKNSAQQEATRILNNALSEAESTKKAQLIEAKDEIHKLRSDADREIRERRNEVQRQEKRLNQREEYLDKRSDTLEKKNENLSEKLREIEDEKTKIDSIKKSQLDMLERLSGLSQEEAKKQLMQSLESELDVEKSKRILEYEEMIKDQSDVLAREIISTAIQRCAADHTAETTVSVVALPNDEMKGRIIGREGVKLPVLHLKDLFKTEESTQRALKKCMKNQSAKLRQQSKQKAKRLLLLPTAAIFIPSLLSF